MNSGDYLLDTNVISEETAAFPNPGVIKWVGGIARASAFAFRVRTGASTSAVPPIAPAAPAPDGWADIPA